MKNIFVIFLCLSVLACSPQVRTPTDVANKQFPRVYGKSLANDEIIIPDSFKDKVTVLLIGYQQRAQFDIDRWILGILQADVRAHIVEVPTIAGMMPQMVQGFIDNGMRSGIPKNDWASVVTVYKDAPKIIEAIGNERPQSAHVVVLNRNGEIQWTYNLGYSAQKVLELKELIERTTTPRSK